MNSHFKCRKIHLTSQSGTWAFSIGRNVRFRRHGRLWDFFAKRDPWTSKVATEVLESVFVCCILFQGGAWRLKGRNHVAPAGRQAHDLYRSPIHDDAWFDGFLPCTGAGRYRNHQSTQVPRTELWYLNAGNHSTPWPNISGTSTHLYEGKPTPKIAL